MKYTFMSFLLVFSSFTHASFVCTGKIERLGLSPSNGDVHIQIQPSTGIFRICNFDSATGGISTDSCKSMYSTLLAARVSEKNVSFHFTESVGTCASLGSWEYPSSAPYFFEIEQNF